MRDDYSSPDPLNDDSYISTPKPQNLSRITHNIPSQISSNKRQTFQLDVGNEISPQKIRVTVEASDNCSNDDSDVAGSLNSTPSRQKRNIKKIKHSNKNVNSFGRQDTAVTPREGRGRLRKINSAASVRKTPINKNLRSKTVARRSINLDQEKEYEIHKTDSPEKTPKRMKERIPSRSRKPKDTPQNSPPTKPSEKEINQALDTKTKKVRNSRNNSSQPVALHDTSHSLSVEDNFLDLKRTNQNDVNLKSTRQNSSSIRSKFNDRLSPQRRSGSKNNVTQVIEDSYTYHGDFSRNKNRPYSKYYPSPASPEKLSSRDSNKTSRIAMETHIKQGFDSGNDCENENENESMKKSQIEEYRESDTILESEEFSMISVESLSSMQEYVGSSFFDGKDLRNKDASRPNNTKKISNVGQAKSNHHYRDLDNHLFENALRPSRSENNRNSNSYEIKELSKGESPWSNKNNVFRELNSDGTRLQKNISMAKSEVFDEHIDLFPNLPATVADADIPATLEDGKYSHAPDNFPRSLPIQNLAPDLSSSRIRLLTPKKTSSPIDGGINDFESPSPIGRAPVMKSSGDLLNSSLIKSCMPSSPTAPKPRCQSKNSHLRQDKLPNSSVIISSPSSPLPPYGEKSRLSLDQTPRISQDEVSFESSNMISQYLIAEPSSKFTRDDNVNHLTKECTENELKYNFNVKSSLLLPQKQLEDQSQTQDHCYKNSLLSIPSVKSHTLEKDPKQYNTYSTSDEIKRAAVTDHCNSRNEDMMGWQSEEPMNTLKRDSSIKFDESSDNLDEDGEDDFDLLLETINSTSPVALKLHGSSERISKISRSPDIGLNYRKNLDNEIIGSEPPDKKEQNNQEKNFKITTPMTKFGAHDKNEKEEITHIDNDYSKTQTFQKLKFHPTVRKTPDPDGFTFSMDSPVDEIPRMPMISRKLSAEASNINNSPFSHSPKSANFDNLSACKIRRPFTPISQKAELNPQTRMDSLPLESTNLNTSHRSSRGLFPTPFNPKTKNIENHPQSNTRISSPSLHETNPTSSSQAVNIQEKNISQNNHTIQCDQSLEPFINSINPSKQSLSHKVLSNTPTKSCLRSPLKRKSEYPSIIGSPIRAVKFVPSSPLPPSPIYSSLSPKTWTRNHWLALNDIVQKWKAQQHCTISPTFLSRNKSPIKNENTTYSGSTDVNYCSRNSTRVISQLLGKYVFNAKGDRLKLEQWHLEAVDEFRGIAPGWEEKVVAMRLFALLIGEKIRAKRKI